MMASMLSAQTTGVSAEAIGQANLRATTDVNSALVGQIEVGTRYPVVGRSQFYPWLLLGDLSSAAPIGWVFAELVTTQGDLNSVPFSSLVVGESVLPTATLPQVAVGSPTATLGLVGVALPQVTATPSPASGIVGLLNGEVNIRLGPGTEYDRLGVGAAGEQYEITAWHTQLPWVQVRYATSPNGLAWIARDLLDIQGDLNSLPAITQINLNLPTLTPTPVSVNASALPSATPVALSPAFQALGSQVWSYVLENGFDPETSRFGALFVMDLQTGEAMAFGENYAFSGTSINKIAILAELYQVLDTPPDTRTAIDIANTMICSENVATNRLLSVIGSGDVYLGAENVTNLFAELGLQNSFLTAPFTIPGATPQPPTRPIPLPTTNADQTKSNPDLSNQMTVSEMGWLLASVYQCAYQNGGPLIAHYSGLYEPRECRQILHVMSSNTVDALLKAGVPADTRVAHKHGWIEDTHGNAAVFFTPGGDYVVVMMLHQPDWLYFEESLPVIAEVSRQVYNYYNPDAPLAEVRDGFIPEAGSCNFAGTALIGDLMSIEFEQ
jgi:beta-lactamase class A/uncharacterized protein YraI